MFRLMIIDDEPIAVDSLYEFLADRLQPEFEVLRAYSSAEALELAQRAKMDILLCDIQMPGLNGFELAGQLTGRWPQCKVIYLTGYNDFQYVHTAIRTGSMDYVLKTEGDDAILLAVQRAKEEIQREWNSDELALRAKQNLHLAMPVLKKDYLSNLVFGEPDSVQSRAKKFAQLGIVLDPLADVTIALGRVDRWKEQWSASDKSLLLYSLENIAEEYFSAKHRFACVVYDHSSFIWLLQVLPADGEEGEATANGEFAFSLTQGISESVQSTCRELLSLSFSLALPRRPCGWDTLPKQVQALRWLMHSQGPRYYEEAMLIHVDQETDGSHRRADSQPFSSSWRRLALLDSYLEHHEREAFFALLRDMLRMEPLDAGGFVTKEEALEVFNGLSSFFLSQLNRYGLKESFVDANLVDRLYHWESHPSWESAADYFEATARFLFDMIDQSYNQRTDELLKGINRYISDHLADDLSLTRLAEVASLNASYLSRLYKQQTGKGLMEFITEARIAKARTLLLGTTMKIHEISAAVGLFSSTYFARVFKKATSLTPQEYRDQGGVQK